MTTIRVMTVEDDAETRAGLERLLGQAEGLALSGSFDRAETALVQAARLAPDVIVLDINLPGMDGITAARQFKAARPAVEILMFTVFEDTDRLFRALLAGASGYLLKRTAANRLVEAIREVHAGGSPLSPRLARRVVRHFQHATASTAPPPSEMEQLSPRELEVLEQLASGCHYKEISDHLGISMDTVRTFIRRIYEKLHVHSRTEAVVKYLDG